MSPTEQIQDANASTEIIDANAAASSTADLDDNAAASSSADTGEKSLHEAVLTALGGDEGASPTSEPGTDAAKAAEDSAKLEDSDKDPSNKAGEDEESDLTEKEMAGLNDKTRRRIETLLAQRKESAQEVETVKAETETFRKDAESYRSVQTFMQTNRVTAKDAGEALHLAGLINNDPVAAYQRLVPIMNQLAAAAGAVLPPDIADAVARGEITQARAQELSYFRAADAQGKTAAQRDREAKAEQDREAEDQKGRDAHTSHVTNLSTLADEWAAEQAQTDPDWKMKEPLVAEKIKLDLHENGLPANAADLKKRLGAIRDDVTATIRRFSPGQKPTLRVSESTGKSGSEVTPPKDAQEAVMRTFG